MRRRFFFAEKQWRRILRPRLETVASAGGAGSALPGRPALVFLRAVLEDNLRAVAAAGRATGVEFLAAVKSFPHPGFLHLAAGALSGFDVSNRAELDLVKPFLRPGARVCLTGPLAHLGGGGDPPGGGLESALSSVVTPVPVVDSPEALAAALGSGVVFAVRLDSCELLRGRAPDDAAFYPSSRFGLPLEEVAAALAHRPEARARVGGLHVHHGSESNRRSTYCALAEALAEAAGQLGLEPAFFDLGGGLHAVGLDGLPELCRAVRRRLPAAARVVFEPGRLLADGAGFARGCVVSRKVDGSGLALALDLSADCHLHWSDPRWAVPVPGSWDHLGRVSLFGATCSEADFIGAFDVPLAADPAGAFEKGSPVFLGGISGYSVAWNRGFNGVEPAQVILA